MGRADQDNAEAHNAELAMNEEKIMTAESDSPSPSQPTDPFANEQLNAENQERAQQLASKITALLNEELGANPSKAHAMTNVLSALTSCSASTVVALRIQPPKFAEQFFAGCMRAFMMLKDKAQG